MKTASKKALTLDLSLQTIVVVPMLIACIGGIFEKDIYVFALLFQLFVGFIQVMSGLIHTIRYEDELRSKYSAYAILYVAFLILIASLIRGAGFLAFFMIFVALVPMCIAIWYWTKTYYDWRNVFSDGNIFSKGQTQSDEDLLDDLEWL
ncbi:MAG: hypothetical protein MK212_21060 [Saprospiraceae bacterium]|nr:hypothetical protein [Saprospiraceae bacterium]